MAQLTAEEYDALLQGDQGVASGGGGSITAEEYDALLQEDAGPATGGGQDAGLAGFTLSSMGYAPGESVDADAYDRILEAGRLEQRAEEWQRMRGLLRQAKDDAARFGEPAAKFKAAAYSEYLRDKMVGREVSEGDIEQFLETSRLAGRMPGGKTGFMRGADVGDFLTSPVSRPAWSLASSMADVVALEGMPTQKRADWIKNLHPEDPRSTVYWEIHEKIQETEAEGNIGLGNAIKRKFWQAELAGVYWLPGVDPYGGGPARPWQEIGRGGVILGGPSSSTMDILGRAAAAGLSEGKSGLGRMGLLDWSGEKETAENVARAEMASAAAESFRPTIHGIAEYVEVPFEWAGAFWPGGESPMEAASRSAEEAYKVWSRAPDADPYEGSFLPSLIFTIAPDLLVPISGFVKAGGVATAGGKVTKAGDQALRASIARYTTSIGDAARAADPALDVKTLEALSDGARDVVETAYSAIGDAATRGHRVGVDAAPTAVPAAARGADELVGTVLGEPVSAATGVRVGVSHIDLEDAISLGRAEDGALRIDFDMGKARVLYSDDPLVKGATRKSVMRSLDEGEKKLLLRAMDDMKADSLTSAEIFGELTRKGYSSKIAVAGALGFGFGFMSPQESASFKERIKAGLVGLGAGVAGGVIWTGGGQGIGTLVDSAGRRAARVGWSPGAIGINSLERIPLEAAPLAGALEKTRRALFGLKRLKPWSHSWIDENGVTRWSPVQAVDLPSDHMWARHTFLMRRKGIAESMVRSETQKAIYNIMSGVYTKREREIITYLTEAMGTGSSHADTAMTLFKTLQRHLQRSLKFLPEEKHSYFETKAKRGPNTKERFGSDAEASKALDEAIEAGDAAGVEGFVWAKGSGPKKWRALNKKAKAWLVKGEGESAEAYSARVTGDEGRGYRYLHERTKWLISRKEAKKGGGLAARHRKNMNDAQKRLEGLADEAERIEGRAAAPVIDDLAGDAGKRINETLKTTQGKRVLAEMQAAAASPEMGAAYARLAASRANAWAAASGKPAEEFLARLHVRAALTSDDVLGRLIYEIDPSLKPVGIIGGTGKAGTGKAGTGKDGLPWQWNQATPKDIDDFMDLLSGKYRKDYVKKVAKIKKAGGSVDEQDWASKMAAYKAAVEASGEAKRLEKAWNKAHHEHHQAKRGGYKNPTVFEKMSGILEYNKGRPRKERLIFGVRHLKGKGRELVLYRHAEEWGKRIEVLEKEWPELGLAKLKSTTKTKAWRAALARLWRLDDVKFEAWKKWDDVKMKILAPILDPDSLKTTNGMIVFGEQEKALIFLFESARPGTLGHELGHFFRRDLPKELQSRAAQWAEKTSGIGEVGGKWSIGMEEAFAEAFEMYLKTGKAPAASGMAAVFSKFKTWIEQIMTPLVQSGRLKKVDPEIRAIFDEMFDAGAVKRGSASAIRKGKRIARASKEVHKLLREDPFIPGGRSMENVIARYAQKATLVKGILKDTVDVASEAEIKKLRSVQNSLDGVIARAEGALDSEEFIEAVGKLDPQEVRQLALAFQKTGGKADPRLGKLSENAEKALGDAKKGTGMAGFFGSMYRLLKAEGAIPRDWSLETFLETMHVGGYVPHMLTKGGAKSIATFAREFGGRLAEIDTALDVVRKRSHTGTIEEINEGVRSDIAEMIYREVNKLDDDAKVAVDAIKDVIKEQGLDKIKYFETDGAKIMTDYSGGIARWVSNTRYVRNLRRMFPDGDMFASVAARNGRTVGDAQAAAAGYRRVDGVSYLRSVAGVAPWSGFAKHEEALRDLLQATTASKRGEAVFRFLKKHGVDVDDVTVKANAGTLAEDLYLPHVYADTVELLAVPSHLEKWAAGDNFLSKAIGTWDDVTNFFKVMTTVLAPAFHGRNFISNVVTNTMTHGFAVVKPSNQIDSLYLMRAPEVDDAGLDVVWTLNARTTGGQKYSITRTIKEWRQELRRHGIIVDDFDITDSIRKRGRPNYLQTGMMKAPSPEDLVRRGKTGTAFLGSGSLGRLLSPSSYKAPAYHASLGGTLGGAYGYLSTDPNKPEERLRRAFAGVMVGGMAGVGTGGMYDMFLRDPAMAARQTAALASGKAPDSLKGLLLARPEFWKNSKVAMSAAFDEWLDIVGGVGKEGFGKTFLHAVSGTGAGRVGLVGGAVGGAGGALTATQEENVLWRGLKGAAAGMLATGGAKAWGEGAFVIAGGMGRKIEEQAKIASYLAGRKAGMSADAASDLVHKTLFDYNDLSKFERHWLRRIFPFYTWSSKNATELQPWLLQNRPLALSFMNKFFDAADGGFSSEHDMALLPVHMQYRAVVNTGLGKIVAGFGLPQEDLAELFRVREIGEGGPKIFPSGLVSRMHPAVQLFYKFALGKDPYYNVDLDQVRSARDLRYLPPFMQEYVGYRKVERFRTVNGIKRRYVAHEVGHFMTKFGTKEPNAKLGAQRLALLRSVPAWRLVSEYNKVMTDTFMGGIRAESGSQASPTERALATLTGIKPYAVDWGRLEEYAYRDFETKLYRELERQGRMGEIPVAYKQPSSAVDELEVLRNLGRYDYEEDYYGDYSEE